MNLLSLCKLPPRNIRNGLPLTSEATLARRGAALFPCDSPNGRRFRIHRLTAISMGGWGTWFLAKEYPDRFAAIAPLCGFPDSKWAPALKDVPIWTFHGTNDTAAPIIDTESMLEALQKLGGNPNFTPIVGGDHDIAKAVCSRDDLYQWFLEHRLPGFASKRIRVTRSLELTDVYSNVSLRMNRTFGVICALSSYLLCCCDGSRLPAHYICAGR